MFIYLFIIPPTCFHITFKLLCFPNWPANQLTWGLCISYQVGMDPNSFGFAIIVYIYFERERLFVCDLFVQVNYKDLSSLEQTMVEYFLSWRIFKDLGELHHILPKEVLPSCGYLSFLIRHKKSHGAYSR